MLARFFESIRRELFPTSEELDRAVRNVTMTLSGHPPLSKQEILALGGIPVLRAFQESRHDN